MLFGVFAGFIGLSYFTEFQLGIDLGNNFYIFAKDIVLILPPAFILIGLFDVWASKESIEKSFGKHSDY